jgi:hypothetical protein
MKFCLIFSIYLPIWIKLAPGDINKNVSSDLSFIKIGAVKSRTLLWGVNESLSYFPHLCSDLY